MPDPSPDWLTPEFTAWLRQIVAENVWRCEHPETPKRPAPAEADAGRRG